MYIFTLVTCGFLAVGNLDDAVGLLDLSPPHGQQFHVLHLGQEVVAEAVGLDEVGQMGHAHGSDELLAGFLGPRPGHHGAVGLPTEMDGRGPRRSGAEFEGLRRGLYVHCLLALLLYDQDVILHQIFHGYDLDSFLVENFDLEFRADAEAAVKEAQEVLP